MAAMGEKETSINSSIPIERTQTDRLWMKRNTHLQLCLNKLIAGVILESLFMFCVQFNL